MAETRYRYAKRPDDLKLNRRRLVSLLLCAVACILVFVALVDIAWTGPFLRIGALLAVATIGLTLFYRRDEPNFEVTSLGPPRPASPGHEEIKDAERYVLRNYTADAMNAFIHLLLDGPRHLSRVHEDVEARGRLLAVRTTLQYRIGITKEKPTDSESHSPTISSEEGPSSSTLIPIAIARKGFLFDGLRITSSAGVTLPTLTQWETRGLMALAVESLFRLARRESSGRRTGANLRDDDVKIMWDVITNAVCQVGDNRHRSGSSPVSYDSDRAADREANARAREAALGKIAQLSDDISPYWREKIEALCRTLAASYVIIAEAPVPSAGHNTVVEYSSYYSPERMHLSKYERLRSRCGLSPMTIDVPMTRALHADSYHFEATAPSGCYVFSHHLEALGSREPLKQGGIRVGTTRQYARLYHNDGRAHAHLYIRHQGTRPDIVKDQVHALGRPDLKSIVRFRETPPGVLGNAAVLAIASAVVIAFFGISRVGIDSPVGSASLPPLVLAIPAFIASALGRAMDHEKLARAPLAAYFGLNVVIGLSLSSALLYVFEASRNLKAIQQWEASGQSAEAPLPPMPGELDFTILGGALTVHTDIFWLTTFFVAAVAAAYLSRERRNAVRYYLTITERRALQDGGAVAEGPGTGRWLSA